MTVAVRPPEYFPRLELAALMVTVDRFVLADTFPYSRQSAQNRCRIRTAGQTDDSTAWLTVPVVAGAVGRPIHQVEIAPDDRWRRVHVKTLLHHYGSAPYFAHYGPEMMGLIEASGRRLADLSIETARFAARALGARAEIVAASELTGAPSSLAEVLEVAGADELITLPESAVADASAAGEHGIPLRLARFEERPRRQNFAGFAPGCSVLDLILNHGPESSAYLLACLEP